MDTTDGSTRHSLQDDIGSPSTPCVSRETLPVPIGNIPTDDSLVGLEASQDELET